MAFRIISSSNFTTYLRKSNSSIKHNNTLKRSGLKGVSFKYKNIWLQLKNIYIESYEGSKHHALKSISTLFLARLPSFSLHHFNIVFDQGYVPIIFLFPSRPLSLNLILAWSLRLGKMYLFTLSWRNSLVLLFDPLFHYIDKCHL